MQISMIILLIFSFQSYFVESKQIEIQKRQIGNFDKTLIQNSSQADKDTLLYQENKSNYFIRQYLNNIGDYQYVIQIYIGQNVKPFSFLLDTGSNILWVPGSDCQLLGNLCHTSNYYDYTKSQTAIVNKDKKVEIKYGQGQCEGYLGEEFLKINQESKPFKVSLLFVSNDKDMDGMQADGIIGLSNDSSTKNYLEYAQESEIISSSLFALELKKQPEISYFYFDDIPEYLLNDLVYLNTASKSRWLINTIGVYMNDSDYTDDQGNQQVLIDSGASFLHLTKSLYDNFIHNYASKICYFNYGEYVCNCNEEIISQNLPVIKFYTQEGLLEIYPQDYIITRGNNCQLAIDQMQTFEFNVLGDVFLRKHLVIFDKEKQQMGFGNIQNKIQHLKIMNVLIIFAVFSVLSLMIFTLIIYKLIQLKRNKDENQINQNLLNNNHQIEYMEDYERRKNTLDDKSARSSFSYSN